MTTNRMGLEQSTLSDERLELLITSLIMSTAVAQQTQSFAPSFATQNELQVAALRELLAYRKASKEADGDDNFYSWFSREWEQYYQPNQYTTSAKQHLGAIAESAWFACRAVMLKSVTNEP